MTGIEKGFVIAAFVNLAIYTPIFLGVIVFEAVAKSHSDLLWRFLVPWHLLGAFLVLLALYATLKDLFARSFVKPHRRYMWLVLILATNGIGWIAYLFLHGFKPRTPAK
jgi:ABC-type enterochelin transport system permease subunit